MNNDKNTKKTRRKNKKYQYKTKNINIKTLVFNG